MTIQKKDTIKRKAETLVANIRERYSFPNNHTLQPAWLIMELNN